MNERAGLEPGEFSEVPGLLIIIPYSLLEAPRHSCLGGISTHGKTFEVDLKWAVVFLFCFLNSENGRVERKDRKDCFRHRDTCCCLFAWLQFREPGLHALYRQQPLAPHSPTVWGMTLALYFTDEEREAYVHRQVTLCCRARTQIQVYPNVQESLNHIAPLSLINEKKIGHYNSICILSSQKLMCARWLHIYEGMWVRVK